MHMRITLPLLLLSLTTGLFAESTAGLHWTAPPGWTSQGPQPMRAATYTISAAAGDHDNGECGVYFFGTGQGGSIDANIERWKGQFRAPDGKPAVAKVAKRNVHGLAITTIDTSGQYSGMGGPLASGPAKSGYRLLGAIVEAPGGNIFLKFAGPMKTVTANQTKFEQLLASFQKDK